MEFYPYYLYVSERGNIAFDENGFAVPTAENLIFYSKCRDYSSSNSGKITKSESKEITNVSSMIMLPLSCPTIEPNVLIVVKGKNNEVRLKGNVIRFERNQLHCRVWV